MSEKGKENTEAERRELVLARIRLMPPDYKLSVGEESALTKEQILERVQKRDAVGKQIIEMHMNFIRALTSGRLIQAVNR